VLAHHERLQQSVRGNRGGEFLQPGVGGGRPADIVVRDDELAERD
jgi:hypothetical protein